MTVVVSLAAFIVLTGWAGTAAAGAAVLGALAGDGGADVFCCGALTRYFWAATNSSIVTAKTIITRLSMPGWFCGFWNSLKVVCRSARP